MSDVFENKGALTATIVVAAADSLNPGAANFVCDGVNDEVEIQAALDALPATGGEVVLLDGTFNVETTINLDSYQTLRGMGWNTILTTSTAALVFLSAIGGAGTEKVGICIRDMQIDGGAGAISDCGIYFEYVDYSLIQHVYSRRHDAGIGTWWTGIYLTNSDFNRILNNTCLENHNYGIYLQGSSNNTVSGNHCHENAENGIFLDNISSNNTVSNNYCFGNLAHGIFLDNISSNNTVSNNYSNENGGHGIYLDGSSDNTVSGNHCNGNGGHGIYLYGSSNNIISGNYCLGNSQSITNTQDDIFVDSSSSYNNIQGNTCRAGGLGNVPRYGISIEDVSCISNIVIDNDLYDDGFGTAPFNDAGTGTKLNTYVAFFFDAYPYNLDFAKGLQINANGVNTPAFLRLPDKVHQVVRIKIYAVSRVAEADHMRLEVIIYGGADNEPYNTHNGSIANHPSTSVNFAVDDVIFWTVTTAGALALKGGDSVNIQAVGEVAGGADCATDAYFRTAEIEYV
jgi:parallel beta-helix repeat protein